MKKQMRLAVEEDAVADVIEAVRGLAAFGVPLVPDAAIPTNVAWAVSAWKVAFARLRQATATLVVLPDPARETPATTGVIVDVCRAVAEAIFGDGFLLLLTKPDGFDSFHTAITAPAMKKQPTPSHLNAFVGGHAPVQAGVGRLAEAQLLGGALGIRIPLHIVQLTEHKTSQAADMCLTCIVTVLTAGELTELTRAADALAAPVYFDDLRAAVTDATSQTKEEMNSSPTAPKARKSGHCRTPGHYRSKCLELS